MQNLHPISEEKFNPLRLNLAKFFAGITFIQRREYARLAALMDFRISLDEFSTPLVDSCLLGQNPTLSCAELFEPRLICTSDSFSRLTEPVNASILYLKNFSPSTTHLPDPELKFFYSDFFTSDEHESLNATFRLMCALSVLSDCGAPLHFKHKADLISAITNQNQPINRFAITRIIDILSLRANFLIDFSSRHHQSRAFSDHFLESLFDDFVRPPFMKTKIFLMQPNGPST